jgi:hypothetical protein
MKCAVSLLVGALIGLVAGLGISHVTSHADIETSNMRYSKQKPVRKDDDGMVVVAINGLTLEKPQRDKYFAEVIATYYYNLPSNSTNRNVLFWRSEIEAFAKTNALVAAEIEAIQKAFQNHK